MTKEEIKAKAIELAKAKVSTLGDGEVDVFSDDGDIDLDCEGGVRVAASVWVANWEIGLGEGLEAPADLADEVRHPGLGRTAL